MRWKTTTAVTVTALVGWALAATTEIRTYSRWMASSIISRGQGIMTGSGGSSELLQAGITQKAFTALVAQYPDDAEFAQKVQGYISASAASVAPFVQNATYDALSYPMDRLSNGNALLSLSSINAGYGLGNSSTLRAAAESLRRSIDLNRRNNESGLWYFVYPEWSYLDGMYSLAPYYTLYTLAVAETKMAEVNTTALDDMLLQLELLWRHTHNETSGLLVHGYDESRRAVWANPETGASPHVWGRSLGWFAMALVDTLEILSGTENARLYDKYTNRLREMYQSLASALISSADPATGAWWQVLDQPGRQGNYIESSGSAMFAYALMKGTRLGYLGGLSIAATAPVMGTKARTYLTESFVVDNGNGTLGYNGTVSVCSLNSSATYEYYVGQPINYNSVLGSAAYVLASLEAERLGNQ
ncbi:hypothetical protein JX265_012532 [Neoarthrinium moseri]|uniref:Uncharacterized protein n=1 Tax=Neoarthrinium moseri TaxID=1658444 RepID=A0A9Q0AGP7_9PEZI|nr:hypothetical protein JX265_012835 [Neoarthrinium moseri]KAI1854363.1 hypothetical protein JX265_012532 [Neoarthrinium moseri]